MNDPSRLSKNVSAFVGPLTNVAVNMSFSTSVSLFVITLPVSEVSSSTWKLSLSAIGLSLTGEITIEKVWPATATFEFSNMSNVKPSSDVSEPE